MSVDQQLTLAQTYRQFEDFPFNSDPTFLEGLSGILNSDAVQGKPAEEKAYMIGSAKVFYFNKTTGNDITWGDYVKYVEENMTDCSSVYKAPPITSMEADPPAVKPSDSPQQPKELTFAEITELIQSGQSHLIPNNDTIPGGVNDSTPSTSSLPARKKPWELKSESLAMKYEG